MAMGNRVTGRTFLLNGVTLERGGRVIVSDVSMEARSGELIVLRGASGSGKTTILRAMAGLDAFETGTIQVGEAQLHGGKAPDAAMLHRLRRSVGLVFQFHCLFEHMTALQNVMLAPVHVYRRSPREAERRARELLSELGVEARALALPRQLSGGEAQRVAIARALAVDPPVLLMDEPMASLDPSRRAELGAQLRRLTGAGRTLMVTSHDEAFSTQFATRIVTIDSGKLS
ncbi:MAG TPA: ATP-binding cassette domain-containing protein [Vicinamibacterales bacterium]|nr:ATP-binding cassette domain-containing protein [Vicinamibacterales bacterium]